MSVLGTDVVAMACILGGATVSGAATAAMLHSDDVGRMDCAVETVEASPQVMLSLGDEERTVMVRPHVRVHKDHRCRHMEVDREVQLRMEEVRRDVERARDRMERAPWRSERLDRERLEKAGRQLEIQAQALEGLDEELEKELELRLEEAMKRLEERLQQLDGEIRH
jgi:exonuclease VII large subunit